MNWLYIFLGFSLLILLHEGGHYLAAKATGMRVERFFLFFGPTIWSFRRGETEYGIKSIPIGGYVKITGMNPEEEVPPEHEHRSYHRQKVWKRIVVVAAGPAVNIALAFAILFGVFSTSAQQLSQSVDRVQPGGAAAKVLQPGDRIVAVDGKSFSGADNDERGERFRDIVASHKCAGQQVQGCVATTPVQVEVRRRGDLRTFSIYPKYDKIEKRTLLGFVYGVEDRPLSATGAARQAVDSMWFAIHRTASIFSHIFEEEQRKQLTGIVGVSDAANQTLNRSGAESLLLLALVSLSLGLVNLLPILPLDGGHIFWALVEKLRGRPASLRAMERATVIGFALVLMLMVIGLTNDIGRLGSDAYGVR